MCWLSNIQNMTTDDDDELHPMVKDKKNTIAKKQNKRKHANFSRELPPPQRQTLVRDKKTNELCIPLRCQNNGSISSVRSVDRRRPPRNT